MRLNLAPLSKLAPDQKTLEEDMRRGIQRPHL